ncbi:SCO family protein [Rudanella paleaurantiibacter]|uniref:SCO family protein n=1 Tax=Rudanella paleaurantiibacter TaxID=2614655 RepID=A0A7J5U1I2_9BACT|nr:SCO family protein [Rudanella paleaurantiibacter]KAB7731664.1 SCO family protein [Rudanella paleaurantiibacter]
MKRNRKAGILLIVLLVPALAYILLKGFGQNHYGLRRYIPVIDSTTGEPLIQKQVNDFGQEVEDTVFRVVPGFRLVNQDGSITDSSVVKGKIHVASFFFTRCGTVCPRISSELTRVQDVFREKGEVTFVSFSVDPEHDKPEQLKAYAKRYDAIPGKWFFLTGDKAQIYNLAQHGYFLPVVDHGVSYGSPDETFIHSEKLVLVDKAGNIRGFYDGTDKKDVDRLILEIRVLLDIYSKQ